jgi:hypothetical protein
MKLLHHAVGLKYCNADVYRSESALNPLRTRPDFQVLMTDLNFPSEPFAPQ